MKSKAPKHKDNKECRIAKTQMLNNTTTGYFCYTCQTQFVKGQAVVCPSYLAHIKKNFKEVPRI